MLIDIRNVTKKNYFILKAYCPSETDFDENYVIYE
jgi:hypothetical protein